MAKRTYSKQRFGAFVFASMPRKSDRHNLMTLGIGVIGYDRNQRAVKALRRKLQAEGFSVSVVRSGKPQWSASPAESAAFSGSVPAYLQAA